MTKNEIALPLRGKGDKQQIETRPIYVEEWLDSLPYIDFHSTCRVLHAALQATNRVAMKPGQRLELIQLYNRPYQYYLESHISSGAQHTLHSVETMQSQLEDMKLIAADLAHASRMTTDNIMSHKSFWGQNKPMLGSVLQAIHYSSHALLFSFLEYAPPAENVWFELNYLYNLAENLKQNRISIDFDGSREKSNATTVEHLYKRILLVSLADPLHLPFGAVWEIYEQVDEWAKKTDLYGFEKPDSPEGIFVVNLDKDSGPVPYEKFDANRAGKPHRIIDTGKLLPVIDKHIDTIDTEGADSSLCLSRNHAKLLLSAIRRAWSLPPERSSPRQASFGNLALSHGLNATYYYINNGEDFGHKSVSDKQDQVVIKGNITALDADTNYTLESWTLADKSSKGLAVLKAGRPESVIRVGDLVGFSPKGKADAEDGWVIGALRWLQQKPDSSYKAGIEALAKKMLPAAIRVPAGTTPERAWKRALLGKHPAKNTKINVITNRGLYASGKRFEIEYKGSIYTGAATKLHESATGFERFDILVRQAS